MARSDADPIKAHNNRQTNQRLTVNQGSWYEAINSPIDGAARSRFFYGLAGGMLLRLRFVPWCRRCFPQGWSCAATQRGRLWMAWRDRQEKVGQWCQAALLQGRLWRPMGANLSQSAFSRPAVSSTTQHLQPDGSPLVALLCFCKYKGIFKEFDPGKGGRCLKVKHDLKLSLYHSFYNQLVTCLALNTVYVHN